MAMNTENLKNLDLYKYYPYICIIYQSIIKSHLYERRLF